MTQLKLIYYHPKLLVDKFSGYAQCLLTCLKDKEVEQYELRKGLKVKKNIVDEEACNYFNTAEGSKKVVAVVDSVVDPDEVVVRFGNPPNISNSQTKYFSSWEGVPTFCYNC